MLGDGHMTLGELFFQAQMRSVVDLKRLFFNHCVVHRAAGSLSRVFHTIDICNFKMKVMVCRRYVSLGSVSLGWFM